MTHPYVLARYTVDGDASRPIWVGVWCDLGDEAIERLQVAMPGVEIVTGPEAEAWCRAVEATAAHAEATRHLWDVDDYPARR